MAGCGIFRFYKMRSQIRSYIDRGNLTTDFQRPSAGLALRMKAAAAAGLMMSNVFKKIGLATFACFFALVGALVGLLVGTFAGLTKGDGFKSGARAGAFWGALVSVQLLLGPRPPSLGYTFLSISRGTFLEDWARPAIFTTYENQAAMFEENSEAHLSILGMNTTTTGMLPEAIKKLPDFVVGKQDNMMPSIKGKACAICLQNLDLGDAARSLPQCGHPFHMICIDKWLLVHACCPVCRQNVHYV